MLATAVGGFVVVVAAAVAQSTGVDRFLPVVAVLATVAGFLVWVELGVRFGEPRGGTRAERLAAFLARQRRRDRWTVGGWLRRRGPGQG